MLLPLSAFSQTITNIRLESSHDKVWVLYDLQATAPQDVSIVFVSDTKGKMVPKLISGALMRVPAGVNHRIDWEALKDVGAFEGDLYAELTIMSCGKAITDVDGNSYNTVKIGTQCWMNSNLKVTKYRNGDNIPTGLSDGQWSSTTSGAYAIYNNVAANDALYGKLYNWYAAIDSRGLCPTGWHVPSDAEWETLTDFLGGESVAGGAMKSTATQPAAGGWNSPNTDATNSSGFTGLTGGCRDSGGGFNYLGVYGTWWSSSDAGSGDAWTRYLNYDSATAYRYYNLHRLGFSVRCARD